MLSSSIVWLISARRSRCPSSQQIAFVASSIRFAHSLRKSCSLLIVSSILSPFLVPLFDTEAMFVLFEFFYESVCFISVGKLLCLSVIFSFVRPEDCDRLHFVSFLCFHLIDGIVNQTFSASSILNLLHNNLAALMAVGVFLLKVLLKYFPAIRDIPSFDCVGRNNSLFHFRSPFLNPRSRAMRCTRPSSYPLQLLCLG